MSDYMTYRGKCKEMSEALIASDPTLILVRGYYYDIAWGKQAHWWCKKPDGTIVDPTKNQFPTKGNGAYIEYDGHVECSNCGKKGLEDDFDTSHGRYVFCSYQCYGQFVGAV